MKKIASILVYEPGKKIQVCNLGKWERRLVRREQLFAWVWKFLKLGIGLVMFSRYLGLL